MARRPNPIPSYRLHKQSGQAVVTLRDGTGKRRDVLLGIYNTPESKAEYRRVLAEWEDGGGRTRLRSRAVGAASGNLSSGVFIGRNNSASSLHL